MDVVNMLINVAAIFGGLGIYIYISHTKWGKEHEAYQYLIMLIAMIWAALLGGFIRWLIM